MPPPRCSLEERFAMAIDKDRLILLLLRQRAMVLGYIGSIVRDWNLAEDLFQEISIVVIQKGGEVESEERFPAWLRTVARYQALNFLRDRRRAPHAVDIDMLDALDAQWDESDEEDGTETINALRNCLKGLSPYARKLIELRYEKRLSGKTLADKVARPVNVVYVALSRAHRHLADCVRHNMSRAGAP
jgi:RNA polymerase sigma-70 factor, ECF subfamily